MSQTLDESMTQDAEAGEKLRKVGSDWVAEEEGGGFGDHLDDLRKALVFAIILPVILVFAIWPFWGEVWGFIEDLCLADYKDQLSRLKPMDTFSLSMKISLYAAISVALPWITAAMWWFISPGLYPHERRFGRFAIPLSIGLFYAGVVFALNWVIPSAFSFLMGFGNDVVANANFGLEDTSDLVFAFMIIMGICFELPIIVAPGVRFGLIKAEWVHRHRRGLIFVAVLLGAILTPTGDPVNMMLVATPIYFLIEGGVLLGGFWKRFADRSAAKRGDDVSLGTAFREGLGEGGFVKEGGEKDFVDSLSKVAREFGEGVRESRNAVSKQLDGDDKTSDTLPQPESTKDKTGPELGQQIRPSEAEKPATARSVRQSASPTPPVAPRAPLSATDTQVNWVMKDLAQDKNVPPLPKELRRRIDHYIRLRLDSIMGELKAADDSADQPPEETKDPSDDANDTPESR